MYPSELLINGKLVQGQGREEQIINPATGEVVCTVNEAAPDQVDAAVKAATAAFDTWRETTPKERGDILLGIANWIEENGDTLAQLE